MSGYYTVSSADIEKVIAKKWEDAILRAISMYKSSKRENKPTYEDLIGMVAELSALKDLQDSLERDIKT